MPVKYLIVELSEKSIKKHQLDSYINPGLVGLTVQRLQFWENKIKFKLKIKA